MCGGGDWGPGEATDDTQMAVLVAESLLDRGGLDGPDIFARFQQWAAADPKDIGLQTEDVLTNGMPWDLAAAIHFQVNRRAAGNGSLMRASSSAVYYARAGRPSTMDAARRIAALASRFPRPRVRSPPGRGRRGRGAYRWVHSWRGNPPADPAWTRPHTRRGDPPVDPGGSTDPWTRWADQPQVRRHGQPQSRWRMPRPARPPGRQWVGVDDEETAARAARSTSAMPSRMDVLPSESTATR